MDDLGIVVIPVIAVIVSLTCFILALRPWIKDVVRAEIGSVRERVAVIEEKLNQISLLTQKIADLMPSKSNPNGKRQELLEKWKQGILTYEESIELRNILSHEALQAGDAKKALLTSGLIGLLLYGLNKKD